MYAIRTPTNSEIIEEAMGCLVVIASAISLSVAEVFIFHATHASICYVLAPISMTLLFVGWEIQVRNPRGSINLPPLLLVACVSILTPVIWSASGLQLLGVMGLITALFLVPFSLLTMLGSFRSWLSAEGSTKGKRACVSVDVQIGLTCPQEGNYGQKFRAAEEIFDNARFPGNAYPAASAWRAPREWHFDKTGASSDILYYLRDSLVRLPRREWQILMIMVSALPGNRAQPAIIVVSDDHLDTMKVDGYGIDLETIDFNGRIPAESIRDIVCYRR